MQRWYLTKKVQFGNFQSLVKHEEAVFIKKVSEVSFNKAVTSYQLEETPRITKNIIAAGESAVHPIAALASVKTKT